MATVSLGGKYPEADPTEQEFIRDICLHPEDDSLRLIFADWLSDNGQEDRAEFVRVQLELEELKKVKGKSTGQTLAGFPVHIVPSGHFEREDKLKRRERELLMSEPDGRFSYNVFEWLKMGTGWPCFWGGGQELEFGWILPGPLGGINPKCFVKFRRGFVEEITLPCLAFLEHAKEIFSHHPVRKVTWEDAQPYAIPLEDPPSPPEREIPAWFHWSPGERERQDWDDVPTEIWKLLEKGKERESFWYWYLGTPQSSPLMVEDLSQACVRWGRGQAGLGDEED